MSLPVDIFFNCLLSSSSSSYYSIPFLFSCRSCRGRDPANLSARSYFKMTFTFSDVITRIFFIRAVRAQRSVPIKIFVDGPKPLPTAPLHGGETDESAAAAFRHLVHTQHGRHHPTPCPIESSNHDISLLSLPPQKMDAPFLFHSSFCFFSFGREEFFRKEEMTESDKLIGSSICRTDESPVVESSSAQPELREASSSASTPPAARASSSSPTTRIRMSSAAETLGAVGGGSGSSGAATPAGGENEDAAWRNFNCFEHPLHAATNAMLNLGGASALSEDSAANSVGSILVSYEHHSYYGNKNPHQHHQPSHQHHSSSVGSLPPNSAHKDGKSMNELWP